MKAIKILINFLIVWPKRIAQHFLWAGPLVARVIVGYTFMLTGWAKLNNLDSVIEYFNSLGVKKPELVAPFVGSWECFGGLFIILGLMSRICGGALAVVMTVAILSAKLSDVDSLQSLLGFEETAYFGIFTWLAICGAGKASLDHILEQRADESRE